MQMYVCKWTEKEVADTVFSYEEWDWEVAKGDFSFFMFLYFCIITKEQYKQFNNLNKENFQIWKQGLEAEQTPISP